MAKVYVLVEVYKKLQGRFSTEFVYESTPSLTLTDDIVSLDCDKSIEPNTDSFSLVVYNCKDENGDYKYNNKFQVDDRLRIHFTIKEAITQANKDTYLRFDGVITETNYDVSVDGKSILVKGQSRLSKLLNFAYPAVYENSTASYIIENLIGHANDGYEISFEDGNTNAIDWDSGNDSTTTTIQYFRNYRPVIEMITELSKQKTNLEYNAYFYLTSDNKFVWKQKDKDANGLNLVEGIDFTKDKCIEKVWEVINAMILDCGKDPSNRNIHAMYYDEASAAEYGLKWANTIEVEHEIASSLLADQKKNAVTWVNNTDINKQTFPETYPITLTFPERDSDGIATGTTATAANDAGFVSAMRTEAKWQGVAYIKSILDLTGHLKPKIDFTLIGGNWELGAGRTGTSAESCLNTSGNPIAQGDMVTITLNSRGGEFSTGKKLRCVQLNHEISKGGWTTTARFEMDEDDAIDYKGTGNVS